MRSILFAALALSSSPAAAPPEEDSVAIVRLKVGTEVALVLDRESFDEARGIHGRRVGDGALLELRWDQIHPEDVRRIRADFGYLPDEPEPVMVEALRITLSGGVQLVGLIESTDGEVFRFRQRGKVLPIRWSAVRRREDVLVDALEVYEGEELYAGRLSQSVPSSALEHYNTALFCESLQLWGRVQEHLQAVVAADPEFKSDVVDGKLKRADLRLRHAADADLLAQCERLAKADRYDDALEKIQAFLTEKPDASLRGEFETVQRSIEVRRGKWLRGKVAANFFFHVDRFAQKLASESALTVEAARKEMENGATDYAIEAVAQQLSIDPEEVRQYWEAQDRPHGSARTYSYGAGSFTLGEQRVFEGMEKAETPAAQNPESAEGSSDEGGNEIQDRIRKLLEERKRQQEAKDRGGDPKRTKKFRIADVPPTKEEWWTTVARIAEKKNFLMAWWAEREEQVQIVRVGSRPCVRCGGKGVLGSITSQGGEKDHWCPRCKGLRIDRLVIFF